MKSLVAALAVTLALTPPSDAQNAPAKGVKLVEYSSPLLPPTTYKGQWWTAPDNCQYSRAGRPGETVWYLIVNTAHSKCRVRLIQRAYSDYN